MPFGQVIRSHSSNYYVLIEGREVLCRPRGKFRLDRQQVLAGDLVQVQIDGDEGRIDQVLNRKSALLRPAVANVDQTLIIFTLVEPEADYPFLDRVLVHAEQAGIEALVVLNKVDLVPAADAEAFCRLYGEQVGYVVVPLSARHNIGLELLQPHLPGRLSVLAGHSGVGKSHLVRALVPGRADVRVGALSEKLGRGRHTTRHVELIHLPAGGLIADTPGFTYLEFSSMTKYQLPGYFPEFRRYASECRFDDCLHRKEPDCAIRTAVMDGGIARSRYENYLSFLLEVEALKRW